MASVILLSGAVSGSVPWAEASHYGFLASDTPHPYCPAAPEARTLGTPSQPLGGSCWGPSLPASPDPSTLRATTSFRPHANGIFSERPFLISLSEVKGLVCGQHRTRSERVLSECCVVLGGMSCQVEVVWCDVAFGSEGAHVLTAFAWGPEASEAAHEPFQSGFSG
ncbi:unnamed protein product [Rangifer tarandus platyrhynchus]|uniref:Uncharacterized protein n=1 Tax=Rangifer tarandus platyrhynchus TaxID=3082113 RepID=A0AC59Z618_RANTA